MQPALFSSASFSVQRTPIGRPLFIGGKIQGIAWGMELGKVFVHRFSERRMSEKSPLSTEEVFSARSIFASPNDAKVSAAFRSLPRSSVTFIFALTVECTKPETVRLAKIIK